MTDTKPFLKLTHEGAMKLLQAAVKKAEDMKQPQCIAVVDDGGHLLAFVWMDGARVLSIDSSTRKAMTAASSRIPTSGVSKDNELKLAHATSGKLTNLKGGLPIIIDGHCVGGIGVGSGTGEQDLEVAREALKVVDGAQDFDLKA